MQPLETADTALAVSSAGTSSQLTPGARIDQFEIVAKLGEGGMGVVYRARDTKLGRDVALKLLRESTPGTDTCNVLCALLKREAQTMARLAHPNLVTVYDTGRHGSTCVYVVLELIEGETLRTWREGRSSSERLGRLLEAGEGLVAAHSAHVYHRDIKPENILVGRDGRARLTDFGISRSAADLAPAEGVGCGCDTSEAAIAEATAISGTPAYMSPQQLRGEPADARCDQFAFAVTAWETLYGVLPFRGVTPFERLTAILDEAIDAPPVTDVPPAVADALRRALRPNADLRYPSARAMLSAVRVAAGT